MTSQNDNDQHNEIQRLERELQERERKIRLRELEAEINQSPLYQTTKDKPSEKSLKQRYKTLVNVGKFLVLVVAVAVTFKIATTLASVILVGAVAWVAYKLFFEGKRSKR
jgi:hypothetical protein